MAMNIPFVDDTRIQQMERLILHHANPDLPLELSKTRGWWMMTLKECLLAMAVYAVVVLVGLTLKSAKVPKLSDGVDKFIKGIQTVYNLAQVRAQARRITDNCIIF